MRQVRQDRDQLLERSYSASQRNLDVRVDDEDEPHARLLQDQRLRRDTVDRDYL